MRPVRYAGTFWKEVSAQIRYAIDRGERDWAVELTEDIIELEQLLAQFPDSGRELARDGTTTLRRLKLRRCPFVVWYTTDPEKVVIARLFHPRQLAPEPRLP